LLVLSATSALVEAASDSCKIFLGASAESLLGQPVRNILGEAAQAALLGTQCTGLQPLVRVSLHGKELRARRNITEARQVLIDIEAETDDFLAVQGAAYNSRNMFTQMRLLSELPEIARLSTELIRVLTGYDRVMLYRFDTAWNGEVIGEARIDGITPYLGLNFPASDIPQQARELLSSKAPRLIPDALYTSSALLAKGAEPIDLGGSNLRSVSPTHIEYLRNMEVRATLVGSLIVEGRLWGLVSCQHKSGPKYIGPSVRDALGWLFEDLAALIEATLSRVSVSRRRILAARRRHLIEAVRQADLKALIHPAHSADLLEVVAADGFALIAKDSILTTGSTPTVDRIRTLQSRRRAVEGIPTLFASSALARDLKLEDAGDSVAGALFVSLRDNPHVTMIWFRRERQFAVYWGGDPERMRIVDETGRFSPRRSFIPTKQDVRGQSLIWSPEELDSAVELASLIEIEALREREAFAQTILNSTRLEIVVLDAQGMIVSVNESWTQFAADNSPPGPVPDYVGLSYQRLSEAASRKPRGEEAAQAWTGIDGVLRKTLTHFSLEYRCNSPDANRWFRMTVFPMRPPAEGAVVTHEDITERKLSDLELEQYRHRLETLVDDRTAALEKANEAAAAAHRSSLEREIREREAKIQSSKLEAVGTLAAGIAHDFNNILASIVACAELTEGALLEGQSEAKQNVATIISGSFRARDLILRMLDFARDQSDNPVPVNIVSQVREALALLRASLPPAIELALQSSVAEGGASVLAGPTQIMQIVMNLCINAAHAMDNHGVIGIRIDLGAAIKNAPQDRQDGVCITVADTGSGMTPAVLERIFDPFFTTKAPGEGSGLGLSVVYGIVKSLGGVIQVRSSAALAGTGTQFQVFLPTTRQTHIECATPGLA
jgi:light-regulated signal transduction histidine kinase (bacteriophytochrome)